MKEECYGAALAFKDVLARALSRRMAAGLLTLTEALELVSRIMHLNATELFGLEDRLNVYE